jgi:hypothetical protein
MPRRRKNVGKRLGLRAQPPEKGVAALTSREVLLALGALALGRSSTNEQSIAFSVGTRPALKRVRLRAWAAAMLATAVFVPGVAAAVVVALFLEPVEAFGTQSPARAFLLGSAIGLLAWATILSILGYRFAWVHRANPGAYSILREIFQGLRSRLQRARVEGHAPDTRQEASRHLALVGSGLGLYDDGVAPGAGLPWTLAVGYVDLWRNAHRADEALLVTEGEEGLVAGAIFDDLRLDGSQIANAADLRQKLRIAVSILSPGSEVYLNRPPSTPGEEPAVSRTVSADAAVGVVRIVRRTINEYRDDRRDGLVRARNHLYATMIFASIMAYAFLGLLMLGVLEDSEDSRSVVSAGTAYYLAAAVIGLVRELHVVLGAHGTEEDYGLRTARLINIPLFSGLAGLAGVGLTALLPATLPNPNDQDTSVRLSEVFNLGESPENLVVAAVFGLTPTLLIRGLQRRAEQYKEDLKTTEAGERPTGRAP